MAFSAKPDAPRVALWALLLWMACSMLMLWLFRGDLPALAFRDPDDAMRLAQVRDWIGGQAFWVVSQYRVNPPIGGPMHWSRIVDMPIAALILLFTPILGVAGAELVACATAPLLLLGGLTAAVFVFVQRVAGRGIALLSVALLLTSPSILVQFTPLRIDHHGWQIALAALALCGTIDKRAVRGGMVAGLALALWLQISSEALPYVALFAANFALRHWMARDQAPRFIAFVTMLGGAALMLLALLRGPQALVDSKCDALSFVYLWPLVAMALATVGAARLAGIDTAARRFLIAAIGGGAALTTLMVTGGPCLSGDPFAALGPILLPSLLGVGASLMAARESIGEARMRWLVVTLLLFGSTLVAVLVMRALCVAHVFALPGIAWLVMRLFARAQASRSAVVRVFGSVALVVLTPAGLCAAWLALAAQAEPAKAASANCRTASVLARLRALPPATLFAPLDMGPDILVQTRHAVIGTAHHRNATGITAVIEGFVDAPDTARAVIARTRAHYVVTCDGLTEYRLYEQENRRGLAALLAKGAIPDWLTPLPGKGPLRIYRVRRD
jgi:hypothetical protein